MSIGHQSSFIQKIQKTFLSMFEHFFKKCWYDFNIFKIYSF